MAAQTNADKVFVALPVTYEDGLSVLSWVLNYFPQDKTKIIITHVISTLLDPRAAAYCKMQSVLSKYLLHCATYKFRSEKLILRTSDDIAEGIVQLIANLGIKNLVMGSAADSDMTDLASEKSNKVRREANLSCKLWFVSDGNLIFTRELNKLTPAPASEVRFHRNGGQTEASSSTPARSNCESTTKEIILAEREIRELKEILHREKQENDQLRREIEENECEKLLIRKEIEQVKVENNLLISQINEYFNQIQVENERRLALEKQVSDLELEIEQVKVENNLLISQRNEYSNQIQVEVERRLALEKQVSDLELLVEDLCIQNENMHCGSSTTLNSEYSLEELQEATQNFSETLKIGEGGFGPVYKGSLRRTTVAIKLLLSESVQGISQFQQEITILTKLRHPNLVTLIGACSEVSALVYEYLSNGSLEDRLTCANNTPPLTWQARTRIIGEICLALIFLHSNKPQLVVHGDLKPGNILLDTNLVSKVSDFGISRILKQPETNATAFFQTFHPSGTFSYIDPEYLSTGILTPKSDIYSFGIIMLRLLTGKPPMNIAGQVQDAARDGVLLSVIDESAGAWPFEQAMELTKIALRCVELSRNRRPDLVNDVWAVVEPLMRAASTYMEPQSHGSELGEESIPSHFICPINQEVMQDPCIAADGFTYEADTIRQWLRGHNTSPLTNLQLPHRNLIQNHMLRSAIQEWLEQHPQS